MGKAMRAEAPAVLKKPVVGWRIRDSPPLSSNLDLTVQDGDRSSFAVALFVPGYCVGRSYETSTFQSQPVRQSDLPSTR